MLTDRKEIRDELFHQRPEARRVTMPVVERRGVKALQVRKKLVN